MGGGGGKAKGPRSQQDEFLCVDQNLLCLSRGMKVQNQQSFDFEVNLRERPHHCQVAGSLEPMAQRPSSLATSERKPRLASRSSEVATSHKDAGTPKATERGDLTAEALQLRELENLLATFGSVLLDACQLGHIAT